MNVIFDLGNVVLDWNIDKILRALDLPDAQNRALKTELFTHSEWLELDCGHIAESIVVESVCSRSSLTPEVVTRAFDFAKKSLTPIPESILLMKEFDNAGIPLYCLSNMSVETYEFLRPRNEFFGIFNGVVVSGIEKMMKPDRRIFELALGRYSLEPSATLFIDDCEANILTANKLGLKTHLFERTEECYSKLRSLMS